MLKYTHEMYTLILIWFTLYWEVWNAVFVSFYSCKFCAVYLRKCCSGFQAVASVCVLRLWYCDSEWRPALRLVPGGCSSSCVCYRPALPPHHCCHKWTGQETWSQVSLFYSNIFLCLKLIRTTMGNLQSA